MEDTYKERSIAYLADVVRRSKLTPTELARRIDVAQTTLSRPLNDPEHSHALSGRTLQKLALFMHEELPAGLGETLPPPLGHPGGTVEVPEYDFRSITSIDFNRKEASVKEVWRFSREFLASVAGFLVGGLFLSDVQDDAMAPTLVSGDRVLVDQNDHRLGTPGVFALWNGDGIVYKRLERVLGGEASLVRVISDNPRHQSYQVSLDDLKVVGRVKLALHRV